MSNTIDKINNFIEVTEAMGKEQIEVVDVKNEWVKDE